MKRTNQGITGILAVLAMSLLPAVASAQVATAEVEEIQEIPLMAKSEIEELVGPIALYPDDLLAIVLPASTFPLQIVEAGRFLDDLEDDSSLEPNEDWDDSIIALLNYPEVVELMNEDLDWTWRLGEAVVGQQSDVIDAIETFRDTAYAAGNLKSDDYQLVAEEDGAIQITPVQEDVIYVPYYEPSEVVVYQPRPVYYYYPRAYPVYYYPYPSYYSFHDHFYHHWFWGVTTAFSIAWHTHHLNVFHHSFYGHPYYGHTYYDHWWYRRPDIHVYNNVYVRNNGNVSTTRYRHGDRWMPSNRRTVSHTDQRITRSRYYPNTDTPDRGSRSESGNSARVVRTAKSSVPANRNIAVGKNDARKAIEFQPRSKTAPADRDTVKPGYSFAPRTSSGARASASKNVSKSSFKPNTATRSSTSRSPAKQQLSTPRQTERPTSSVARSASRPTVSAPSQTVRRSFSAAAPAAKPSASAPRRSAGPSSSPSRQSVSRQSSAPKHGASVSRQSTSRSSAKPAPSKSRSSSSGNRSQRKQSR